MRCSFVWPGNYFAGKEVVYNRRGYHQFVQLKKGGGLQAAVLYVTPLILDDEEKRKQMSEDYGFTQIGEHLPDNITLKDVMDTLPKEVPTADPNMLFDVSYAQILT
jgi:acyl-lipid omega-6 desaturase (Delta-12 desaturase)